jgi:hypothetical protein
LVGGHVEDVLYLDTRLVIDLYPGSTKLEVFFHWRLPCEKKSFSGRQDMITLKWRLAHVRYLLHWLV